LSSCLLPISTECLVLNLRRHDSSTIGIVPALAGQLATQVDKANDFQGEVFRWS
jgi:hypothetical protein